MFPSSIQGNLGMADRGQSENGRQKQDQYKAVHTQWMMLQHQMKDHNMMKLMAIMAERDNAIQECILALAETKAALAERDMAILQRDAAIADRNNAIMERDSAIATLYSRENEMSHNGLPAAPPGSSVARGSKHFDHHHPSCVHPSAQQLSDLPDNHTTDMHISEGFPASVHMDNTGKAKHAKPPRKVAKDPSKRVPKSPRKHESGGEKSNKKATVSKLYDEFFNQAGGGGEDLNKKASKMKNDWKGQDMGLSLVNFDESTMPVPICSCTGAVHQCYKWGNGGWQSACCTPTVSIYPLPMMPNKRHTRMGGRKMSGSVFSKLLGRLAVEGRDLSAPVDMRDHWAKHGSNRYITIK